MNGPMGAATSMNFSHIMDEVLINFEPCRKLLHGFLVGYGVIPMLVWANHPIGEIYEYIDFAVSIGLPVTLKQLGIENVTIEELDHASQIAMNSITIKLTTAKLTKEALWTNMLIADNVANDYLNKKNIKL